MKGRDALPPCLPGVGNATNYRAEHESSDEGEENEVDEAFQSIIAQSCHGLDVVLQDDSRWNLTKENTKFAVIYNWGTSCAAHTQEKHFKFSWLGFVKAHFLLKIRVTMKAGEKSEKCSQVCTRHKELAPLRDLNHVHISIKHTQFPTQQWILIYSDRCSQRHKKGICLVRPSCTTETPV